jgi:hypothetical protein
MTKQEIHDVWFKRTWSASSWAANAENLWRAADILFSAYQASTAEDGEPINWEETELNIPATLLYAYAIENAVKGTLIKKLKLSPCDYQNLHGWRKHVLVVLFDQAEVQTLDEEQKKECKRLLEILTAQILWAGKYPSTFEPANGNKGFFLPEQWEYESVKTTNMPPSTVNIEMRQRLKILFRLLINEIYEDSKTKQTLVKN